MTPSDWRYSAVASLKDAALATGVEAELRRNAALRQLFAIGAQLRNRSRGHGATRSDQCSHACPHLTTALTVVVQRLSIFCDVPWAYIHRNLSGKYRISPLLGDCSPFDYLKRRAGEQLPDGVYLYLDQSVPVRLVFSDPEIDDIFLPNGNHVKTAFEVLSYVTNKSRRQDGIAWSSPPGSLPPSETEGDSQLEPLGSAFANVPPQRGDYVKRPDLEKRLQHELLPPARHPILSLTGPGGIGKTSLAIAALHAINEHESLPYDVILWISARDTDLLESGPNSLWQKSIDRSRPESTEWRRLGGMAMGKKPAARQPSPMWVTTADLPTSAGHPFFERLNRVLEEAGFDAFVEGLCAVFYASRLGRPSLRPGRYFRLLFIGYFEGLSSERGIAWRVADSLSLRAFLDLDVTEAPPNHSTLSRTRRLIDVETHVAVFTWVLERLAGAGLVQGKTVGVDATTLEANAAMRSIERRDTGESYEAFVRQLAKASGIETPTRAELARFDRSRKDRKTSNKEWQSPQDTDAKIAKMKDGRTHLAHKAEHGIDLETGAILSVTVQEASEGDSATLPETLTMAAEQVEAVQPDGAEVEEVVADKGYHSDATLVALDEIGVRSYVSEPERGRRCWQDKKTGETPVGKRAAQKALYGNRRRIRGDRGRRLQRRRGELVERPFAHQYETGGLRRVWVRGHENVRKRVLIQAAGCNLGLLLRRLTGVGTPRSLQGRALSAICGLIGRLSALWGRLTASWDFQWTPAGLVGSIAHRQAA